MQKICFIGAGNMAQSIISGLLSSGWKSQDIVATAKTPATCDTINKKYGITAITDNKQAITGVGTILLCVKPKLVKQIMLEIKSVITPKQLLISVVAGIKISSLTKWLEKQLAIIRSMPNTPSSIGCGATGLYANKQVLPEQHKLATDLFTTIGLVEWVATEELIDVVTSLSGSGPAYYFLFMETMATVACEMGLSKSTATNLAKQTALGAAQLAINTTDTLVDLRNKVTSPGGTTEQAINCFNKNNFKNLISKVMVAAATKAIAIATELDKE